MQEVFCHAVTIEIPSISELNLMNSSIFDEVFNRVK